MLTAEVE